jgi:small subunit ribosomal protein S3
MGQKINPYGLRLGIVTDWKSRWYSEKDYALQVNEDNKIRTYLRGQLKRGAVSRIDIERIGDKKVQVDVHTARPGVVIGRGGSEAERLRRGLEKLTGRLVKFNVIEVQSPDLDATLLARSVADQLEGRVSFRRAMKRAVSTALKAGAEGVRVQASGRLGGADMGRREWYLEGRVPLHTLRADIDYGEATAQTTVGSTGVKVWVYKGDVLRAGGPSREKIAAEARLATGGPAQRRRSARSRAEAAAGGKEKRLIEAGGGKRLVEAGGGKRKEGGKRLIEAGGGRKPSPVEAVQEFEEAREVADETLSADAAAARAGAQVAAAAAAEAVGEATVAEAVAEEAVVEAVVAEEVADVAAAVAEVADAEAIEVIEDAVEAESRAEANGSLDAVVDAMAAEDAAAEAVAEAVNAEVAAAEAAVVAEVADEVAVEAVVEADAAIDAAVDSVEDAGAAEAVAEIQEEAANASADAPADASAEAEVEVEVEAADQEDA